MAPPRDRDVGRGPAHHWPAAMWRALAPARAIGRAASGGGARIGGGARALGRSLKDTPPAVQPTVDGSCLRYGGERL